VPAGVGVVWALTRHFVPRPENGGSFADRMTVRVTAQASINDPTSPYRPNAKAAHRADPDIVVGVGSHTVFTNRLAPLRVWYPADVLHFPFRSLEQYERKNVRGASARGYKALGQYIKGAQAREEGRLADAFQSFVVDDEMMKRGLADGSLVVDTRLRDTLQTLDEGGMSHLVSRVPAADADTPTQGAVLLEADGVRLLRWLDELGARLRGVENRPWARPSRGG